MIVSEFWSFLQRSLFPAICECLEAPLTDREQQLVAVLEFLSLDQQFRPPPYPGVGRPPCNRMNLLRAFVAKTWYGLPTTELLHQTLLSEPGLRVICGYSHAGSVPSLATFSRAFHEFADAGLGDRCHEALVREHVGNTPVLHNTRDSTSLPAREKPKTKDPKAPKRRKDQRVTDTLYPLTADEALQTIPRDCTVGRKPNSHGILETWIGYKVHVDWLDGMIPVNVQTTSASVHDSLLAIPMMRQTTDRVPNIVYQLMDQAYDAPAIRTACHDLDQIPLIDGKKSRKDYQPFDLAQTQRFMERTNAERGFSRLKDTFGLHHLRVRKHPNVHFHVMLGVLVLFADQMLRPLGR